jgi:hypothetical protein
MSEEVVIIPRGKGKERDFVISTDDPDSEFVSIISCAGKKCRAIRKATRMRLEIGHANTTSGK